MIGANYDDRGFYIATVDGRETTIYGENKKRVEEVALELIDLVREQFADTENNYGLAFYACGYDGEAQQRFTQQFDGVYVF